MKITKGLVGIVLPVVAMYLIKTGTLIIYKNKVKLIKKREDNIIKMNTTNDTEITTELNINYTNKYTNSVLDISAEFVIVQTDDELSDSDMISCED